jgi:hypothetical protein
MIHAQTGGSVMRKFRMLAGLTCLAICIVAGTGVAQQQAASSITGITPSQLKFTEVETGNNTSRINNVSQSPGLFTRLFRNLFGSGTSNRNIGSSTFPKNSVPTNNLKTYGPEMPKMSTVTRP